MDTTWNFSEDETHLIFFYIVVRLQNDKKDSEKLYIVYYILGNALNNFAFIFCYLSVGVLVYMSANADGDLRY